MEVPMAWSLDTRIPVEIVARLPAATAALAVIHEAGAAVPAGAAIATEFTPLPHAIGCACCGGRPSAAVAFDRVFLARVKGDCAWFDRVVAVAATEVGQSALAAALAEDAATRARFRPA
jgi:hypothetical protein